MIAVLCRSGVMGQGKCNYKKEVSLILWNKLTADM